MKLIKSICIIIFLLLSIGCKKEYEYNTAYIYETKFVHRGSAYYKLKIFYEFEYNDSIYKGDEKTSGTYRIYGRRRYKEGDSILIKHPQNKPNKSEFVKLVHKKTD